MLYTHIHGIFPIREEKGITLIALIITIIVMLILVAISITLLTNSGIFGQASDAVLETRAAQAEEVAALWRIEATMEVEEMTATEKIDWMYSNGFLTSEERIELLSTEGAYTGEYDGEAGIIIGNLGREVHFRVEGREGPPIPAPTGPPVPITQHFSRAQRGNRNSMDRYR